jgi:hypothetical protein
MFTKPVRGSIGSYREYMSEPSNPSKKEYENKEILGEDVV